MKGKELDKFIKNFSDVAEMVEYFDDINNRGICIIPNRLNMSDIFDVIYDISVDKERELIKYTLYQNTLKDEIIHFKMCLPYSAFFTYIRCNYLIPNLVYDNFRYRIKNIIYRTDNMCKYFLDKTKNGKMIYDNKLDKYFKWLNENGYRYDIEKMKECIFIDMSKSFDYYMLYRIISNNDNTKKIKLEEIVIYYNKNYGKDYIFSMKRFYSEVSRYYISMLIRSVLNKDMDCTIIKMNHLFNKLDKTFDIANIINISKIYSLFDKHRLAYIKLD